MNVNKKLEDLLDAAKLSELLERKEEKKKKSIIKWALVIVGLVCAVAGIAYMVYRYFEPDYFDDFDDFDDDFDDDFEDDVFEDSDEEEKKD